MVSAIERPKIIHIVRARLEKDINFFIDVVVRNEADWVIEIHGFLGILNILG